jgi:predicted dehydrogenase
VDVVDISVPQYLHHDIAVAAARAGKHLFCEKPMAINLSEAQAMLREAEAAKVVHYLNHNYRRTPAVMLARQLIDEGKLGRIYHWRGAYQQDWIVDPEFPLTWQLRKEAAGAGPHNDLNSHSVDLSHYLVGEIKSVSCLTASFVKERPLPSQDATAFTVGSGQASSRGAVTVEDASLMMVEFANGAVGSFEATRFAQGRKNRNTFEIYGSEGALTFDLERMNELEFFSRKDQHNAQGFRTILATESGHSFIKNWWPPGHIIGYEHAFTHGVVDFVSSVANGTQLAPNFRDGVNCVRVLEAGLKSAASGRKELL